MTISPKDKIILTYSCAGIKDIASPTYGHYKYAVEKYGNAIEHIENPSEELQLIAVKKDIFAAELISDLCEKAQEYIYKTDKGYLLNINNLSNSIIIKMDITSLPLTKQKNLLRKDGRYLRHISNPSVELQKLAVNNDPSAIQFIDNPSEDLQKLAVKNNGRFISYIDNPPQHIVEIAQKATERLIRKTETFIAKHIHLLPDHKPTYTKSIKKFIADPTTENQIKSVIQMPFSILSFSEPCVEAEEIVTKYINQSDDTIKRAMAYDLQLFKYIDNPSEEIQRILISDSAFNLSMIKNPKLDIVKEALQNDGSTIGFIDSPSEELQKIAVQQNGWSIEFIDNPSEEVQEIAVRQNSHAIDFIKNPSKEIQILAKLCS